MNERADSLLLVREGECVWVEAVKGEAVKLVGVVQLVPRWEPCKWLVGAGSICGVGVNQRRAAE